MVQKHAKTAALQKTCKNCCIAKNMRAGMAGTTSFEILQTSRLPNGRYIGICTVVQQSLQFLGPLPLLSQRNNPVDAMISLF